jgi:hypothetical protein
VLVVSPDGEVSSASVKIGLQTPDLVEITEGIKEGDLVVTGSHSGVRPGTKVNTKLTDIPKSY